MKECLVGEGKMLGGILTVCLTVSDIYDVATARGLIIK